MRTVAGTCTMHASTVDLSKTLVALGKVKGPPTAPIFVPTPNHSHVVDNSRVNTGAIWWKVRPVLVMNQSDWPAADGSSGIRSSKTMDDVEAAGRAIEVGSNFFLFSALKNSRIPCNPCIECVTNPLFHTLFGKRGDIKLVCLFENAGYLFPQDRGRFYHDGRFRTLRDVVNSYDDRFNLGLTEQEKSDLVEYLKSL